MVQPEPDQQLLGPPWGVADFFVVILAGYLAVFGAGLLLLWADVGSALLVVISSVAMALGQAGGIAAILQRSEGRLVDLGFRVKAVDCVFLILGAGLQVAMALAFEPLARAVDSDGTTQAVADSISTADGLLIKVAIVVLVGLIAPIMEEIAFRGVLLAAVRRRMGPAWSVVVTALVFSLFHTLGLQPDNMLAGLITLAELFIIGLVLAGVTIRRGRLGPSIFTHAGFNLVTLTILLSGLPLSSGG